jgi:hypothetical protein
MVDPIMSGALARRGGEGYREYRSTPLRIQAKLVVGQVDDPLESEADRIANQVMRMHDHGAGAASIFSSAFSRIQRKCGCRGACTKCHEEQSDLGIRAVHMKSAGQGAPAGMAAPPIVHEVLSSPSQPLDAATRVSMEPRFGRDFGDVRVHSGERDASQSALAMGARA